MPEGSGQVQAEPEPRTRAGPEFTPCTAPLTPALALTGQCPSPRGTTEDAATQQAEGTCPGLAWVRSGSGRTSRPQKSHWGLHRWPLWTAERAGIFQPWAARTRGSPGPEALRDSASHLQV